MSSSISGEIETGNVIFTGDADTLDATNLQFGDVLASENNFIKGFATINDIGSSVWLTETYNDESSFSTVSLAVRGRGTHDAPTGTLENDVVFSQLVSPTLSDGSMALLSGLLSGYQVSASEDATTESAAVSHVWFSNGNLVMTVDKDGNLTVPGAVTSSNAPIATDWGAIGGTLSDQTDLDSVLNEKYSVNGGSIEGNVTVDGTLNVNTAGNPFFLNRPDNTTSQQIQFHNQDGGSRSFYMGPFTNEGFDLASSDGLIWTVDPTTLAFTLWQNMAFETPYNIQNMADPIQASDAATKNYVDTQFSGGATGTFTSADSKTVTVTGGLITDIT